MSSRMTLNSSSMLSAHTSLIIDVRLCDGSALDIIGPRRLPAGDPPWYDIIFLI
jgi:hypothetical protein